MSGCSLFAIADKRAPGCADVPKAFHLWAHATVLDETWRYRKQASPQEGVVLCAEIGQTSFAENHSSWLPTVDQTSGPCGAARRRWGRTISKRSLMPVKLTALHSAPGCCVPASTGTRTNPAAAKCESNANAWRMRSVRETGGVWLGPPNSSRAGWRPARH